MKIAVVYYSRNGHTKEMAEIIKKAMLTIINHLIVKGMLVYSGGSALGQPYLHLGAVATKDRYEESKKEFEIFGKRIAKKVIELFN